MTRNLAALFLILAAGPADARARRHLPPAQAEAAVPADDLYRRRGYGTGGLLFGHTAQAGACADLAFARPGNCGPRGGYGIYGNGLGYGF